MSIKNILKEWLGVSSADAVCEECEECDDVGASIVPSYGYYSASKGIVPVLLPDPLEYPINRMLCKKCGLIQKYYDSVHLELETDERRDRQIKRDNDYIKAQEYFNNRDEKA